MLYDIFYKDGSFDSNVNLPENPAKGTIYAQNTNWDKEKLFPRFGKWCKK